jgi:hypothetical protein
MLKSDILTAAIEVTGGDREETHGNCETNMAHVAAMWSAYLGVIITGVDVAHMMIQAKQSRSMCGDPSHPDHYIDQCGYAAIAGQIATHSTGAAKAASPAIASIKLS